MHWALGGIGLLWYAGLVSQFVGDQDPLNMIVQGTAGTVLIILAFFFKAQRDQDAKLLFWLRRNQDGGLFDGREIRPDTPLHRFDTIISMVVISFRVSSRYYVGEEPRAGTGAVCVFASLLFGWWGIPWGPIWTVKAVVQAMGGGIKTTVAELAESDD